MTPIISWKGTTLSQLSSVNKYNIGTSSSPFAPHPVKGYRRERTGASGSRANVPMSSLDQPGSTIVNSTSTTCGSCGVVHINSANSNCDACSTYNPASNALRRVRSSGMNSKKFLSSTKQYLDSRSKSYERASHYYIREGDMAAIPGTSASINNVYTTNTVTNCTKTTLTQTSFEYQWVDGTYHTINVPAGDYNVNDMNLLLKNAMILNFHYLVSATTGTKVFFLNIGYNSTNNKVEFTTLTMDPAIHGGASFEMPKDSGLTRIETWEIPTTTAMVPGILISAGPLADALGFAAGSYPTVAIGVGTQDTDEAAYLHSSSENPPIKGSYVALYYKPNNPQYGQQGAVDSSSRLARLRYTTITDSAASFLTALGSNTANAVAYGVPSPGYTVKDKMGYPIKCSPSVGPDGEMRNCRVTTIRNLI